MKEKVLIILYYWPPAGGPGVQRWLKFVKYLSEFDVEPIVYCPENPNYPITDETLIRQVPEQLTILKQPIDEPYRLAGLLSKKSTKKISSGVIPKRKNQSLAEKAMLFVRGNFFIPDARKNWVEPSVNFLLEYLKEHKLKTVITTGPPHSLHLIGLELKKILDINWLADFRDPWTTIGYHKTLKLTKSSEVLHAKLEMDVLNTADEIIVTSYHTKKEFSLKTNKPITVITNGYDHNPGVKIGKDKKFTLSHIGSLLSDRNPKVLWETLAELITESAAFSKHFQLNLIGVVSEEVLESINDFGLKSHTNIEGYVSHDAAIKFQLKSQLLLLIEIDSENTKAIIPGKLYEYIISETPILAIGPKNSDIEKIIHSTNTGTYFNYNQRIHLKSQILNYFKLYLEKNLKSEPKGVEQYSRRALTERLSTLIHSL
ncbi:MAG: glycosyl transferase family 1 [Winogradskyella sp.]|uniref:glycosyl transferase family 1 n=1 Tax=Winogradskyella sp. TaxID=1883156 RepID=UPI0017C9F8D0|nr:glycosyl transferase family 1 [Winogradskyella sp.]